MKTILVADPTPPITIINSSRMPTSLLPQPPSTMIIWSTTSFLLLVVIVQYRIPVVSATDYLPGFVSGIKDTSSPVDFGMRSRLGGLMATKFGVTRPNGISPIAMGPNAALNPGGSLGVAEDVSPSAGVGASPRLIVPKTNWPPRISSIAATLEATTSSARTRQPYCPSP